MFGCAKEKKEIKSESKGEMGLGSGKIKSRFAFCECGLAVGKHLESLKFRLSLSESNAI